jgi:hypothetical protein
MQIGQLETPPAPGSGQFCALILYPRYEPSLPEIRTLLWPKPPAMNRPVWRNFLALIGVPVEVSKSGIARGFQHQRQRLPFTVFLHPAELMNACDC